MVPVKRRLQRIAASMNAKSRRLHRPGVLSWSMLAAKGSICVYCGTELRLEDGSWDHVVAFDKGGTNFIENIVRCCSKCQRAKHSKNPAEYAAHRALRVTCALPGCEVTYQPRWAEYQRGLARYCSHQHAGAARWL